MNTRTLLKSTLIFSALFISAVLILTYFYTEGNISNRGLAIGLGCILCASILAFMFIIRSRSIQESVPQRARAGSDSWASRKAAIWAAKIGIVILIVAFLNGLVHITERPIGPRLLGLGMNLGITWTVFRAMRQLQNGQK